MMEFDLDFEEIFYDGERLPATKRVTEYLKDILRSSLDDFHAKEIGINNLILERLWKGGLLRKYEAIKLGARPKTKWSLDPGNILLRLSDDPEVYHLLQKAARRKQSIVQADRVRGGTKLGDCRISHRAPKRSQSR